MSTSNYSFNTPTVGGSEDTWGTQLNANWTALDTLLNGVTQTEISLLKGQTSLVPAGVIVMWSGSIASIPVGWLLCDGTSGTPDLRSRFVVGAGGTYTVGDTGGADSVTLNSSQIPGHTHTFSATTNTASLTGSAGPIAETFGLGGSASGIFSKSALNGPFTPDGGDVSPAGQLNIDASHSHTVSGTTGSTGGGGSHENRPPYFALAYIMKA
jgi:microcystin-dependent protein